MRVLLKREDLAHTGSHKINNVVGQGLLARRMGKTALVAETGAGQHGVAAATVAAHLGLDCTVYMGDRDIARQELNVFRMELLGADGRPGDARARARSRTPPTRRCGTGSPWSTPPTTASARCSARTRIRGWSASSSGSSATRPAAQCARLLRGPRVPDVVVACVGGGSNAAGTFAGFADTPPGWSAWRRPAGRR